MRFKSTWRIAIPCSGGRDVWTEFPEPRGPRSWPQSVRKIPARNWQSDELRMDWGIAIDFMCPRFRGPLTLSFLHAAKSFSFMGVSGTVIGAADMPLFQKRISSPGMRNLTGIWRVTARMRGSCGSSGGKYSSYGSAN